MTACSSGPCGCAPGNRKGLSILAASTWLYVLIFAPLTGFAILFVALGDEFKASSTATGEIGSVAWAFLNLTTPLPTFLIQKWGPRVVAVIGVLMCGGGLFISTFAQQIWMLFLFYGAIQGLGLCFIQMVATQLITSHFSGSALVRAMSVAAVGETVGMFAISPIFATGITLLGWRMVCQISAITIVTLCLPACYVLRESTHAQLRADEEDIKEPQNKEGDEVKMAGDVKGELEDVHVKSLGQTMRIPGLWIFSVATVLYVLCMAFVMINLVEIMVVQGGTMVDSAWFITIFAVSQTVGKVINVVIGNRLPLSNMKILAIMCLVGGVMSIGMLYWDDVRTYVIAYSIGAIEVFGRQTSLVIINSLYISIGIAFLSASLVGGMSYDLTGSYHSAHIAISIMWMLAALLLLPLALEWPGCCFQPLCHSGGEFASVQGDPEQNGQNLDVCIRCDHKTNTCGPSQSFQDNLITCNTEPESDRTDPEKVRSPSEL